MSNILVIGSNGFIGSHFVEECLKHDDYIMGWDDLSTGKDEYLPDNVEFHQLDITKHVNFDHVYVDNLDYIVNFAVLPLELSLKNSEARQRIHEVNCNGVINICEALKKYNFSDNHNCQFVQISSSEVFGNLKVQPMAEDHNLNPRTSYGASKAAAELYCKSYHLCYELPIKIVRCFNTVGTRMRKDSYANVVYKWMLNSLNKQPMLIHGNGKQTRDFSAVEDIARGIYYMLEHLPIGEVVNLGSGIEHSINDLHEMIVDITNNYTNHEYIPARLGDISRHCADISKAKSLGWEPKIDLVDGLKRTWDWIKGSD